MGRQTFLSLTIRNYRLYFIGQAISWSGTWMQTIAQGILMLQLTGSGTALGSMMALQFMPSLLFGAMAGVITDRYSKRRLIFITQGLSGILALALGLLVAFHLIEVWMVYVLAFLHGCLIALDNPARHAFVTEMVGKDLIKNAISLNSSQVNFARIAGPALAGFIIATMGLVVCFMLNAVSYLAVLLVLFLMKKDELFLTTPAPRKSGQIREGLRYVKSSFPLMYTLIMVSIVGTLGFEFPVILPLFAKFTFHNETAGYAALTSAMGVGAIVGGLMAAHNKKATIQMLTLSCLFFGISMTIAAIAPSLISAILLMLIVGVFSVNFTALATTILQVESDPSMRGRVMSLWTVAFLGSTPIGGPIIGWIGEFFGPRWGMAIGGVSAILTALCGAYFLSKVSGENAERKKFQLRQ